MRKIRKLSFFGILGVVIAVLFLISISFTQAQVQTQGKPPWAGPPDKEEPEEATWAVELPGVGTVGTMLYGDGIMYENNDGEVRIKVEKGYSRLRKGQTAFHYYFCFKLVTPTNRFAGFQNVDLTLEGNPDEGPSGIFPGDCKNIDSTTCMENFLNQDQPHPEYEYFNLKFEVGQGSFTEHLGYIIEGIEDESWGYNNPVKFTSFSDWIKIRVQNKEDFSDPPFEYHNVECDERNHDDGVLTNMNIWIKRLDTNKWRIYVGYDPYEDPNNHPGEDLLLQEQYTQRVEGKGKKGAKTVTVVPLEATGNFSFYIDFIKLPPAH